MVRPPVADGEYITALEFTATESCRDKSFWRLPTDLNAGSGGNPLYMCIMGDTQPPFLTSITVVTGKADRASCPAGTNQSIDLNTGLNTGDTVYVCSTYTSKSRAPTLVKDIIPVVGAIAACPVNYAKIPGDLNSGVLNAPTVSLCVLSKTPGGNAFSLTFRGVSSDNSKSLPLAGEAFSLPPSPPAIQAPPPPAGI
jgi:hypothetical protein